MDLFSFAFYFLRHCFFHSKHHKSSQKMSSLTVYKLKTFCLFFTWTVSLIMIFSFIWSVKMCSFWHCEFCWLSPFVFIFMLKLLSVLRGSWTSFQVKNTSLVFLLNLTLIIFAQKLPDCFSFYKSSLPSLYLLTYLSHSTIFPVFSFEIFFPSYSQKYFYFKQSSNNIILKKL